VVGAVKGTIITGAGLRGGKQAQGTYGERVQDGRTSKYINVHGQNGSVAHKENKRSGNFGRLKPTKKETGYKKKTGEERLEQGEKSQYNGNLFNKGNQPLRKKESGGKNNRRNACKLK